MTTAFLETFRPGGNLSWILQEVQSDFLSSKEGEPIDQSIVFSKDSYHQIELLSATTKYEFLNLVQNVAVIVVAPYGKLIIPAME